MFHFQKNIFFGRITKKGDGRFVVNSCCHCFCIVFFVFVVVVLIFIIFVVNMVIFVVIFVVVVVIDMIRKGVFVTARIVKMI